MFGWLAAHSSTLGRRAPRNHVSRRVRRITPYALVDLLPGLGSVLYLHAASRRDALDVASTGVLISDPAFAPLLQAQWLVAISAVTSDGPREWCECVDRFGRTRARWHLLPDTDYLAWDALTASCVVDRDGFASMDIQPLRADNASVVSFRLREWVGLLVFEQDRGMSLSTLGQQVATRIAQTESTSLRA